MVRKQYGKETGECDFKSDQAKREEKMALNKTHLSLR
jgi:hypothetical protein